MPKLIQTDAYSAHLRERSVRREERRLQIARIAGSEQEKDLTSPPNCGGFGRVRHFRRTSKSGLWPANPLPIDPAAANLGLEPSEELRAQVFQNAACNWRCWYCFVPFRLLDAQEDAGAWLSADELIDLYLSEPEQSRARMLDLTGGQPDLVPEWVPWMMQAFRERGLEGKVYLWSDDNLSTDYFWRYLTPAEQELVATFAGYGRVGCFKGFDEDSFSFNTQAEPQLFNRQFDLFERMLRTGVDLYAYTTFTARSSDGIEDKMARFVDRLQKIDVNLPLRTVPLQVYPFKVVKERLDSHAHHAKLGNTPFEAQQRAIEAWSRELERRFSNEMRQRRITDVQVTKRS
ncbi:putative Fe-S cluster-containing radical SAM superfamily protein [Archangium gephyra]|uniref:Fe-S cluster-containing radical SAM superfamily protein n=1 Tax=Archangium gephyra TaxID=48 RepID=A0ABX9JK26_9BACT|nr:hypothetical protein [Archangium gephyra]REG14183.1 putative Fe-S cluster-containing radical SAM superfamily protein [Archangium gephyra]